MRINRSNPDQPAQRPAPQQAAPTPRRAPLPSAPHLPRNRQSPKKEKPKKKPKPVVHEEYDDDEEDEKPRRRFPFGCLIVLIILALVGFGGYKVSQFYAELDGQKASARPRPSPSRRARRSPTLPLN